MDGGVKAGEMMDSGSAGVVALLSLLSSVLRRISRWLDVRFVSECVAEDEETFSAVSRPKLSPGALDRRGCGAMIGDDFSAMVEAQSIGAPMMQQGKDSNNIRSSQQGQ